MADDSAKNLTQRWIHSHEEDTADEMVFRPASFAFPRSRGRSGFELRPDKSMVEIQPGAADQGAEAHGTWEYHGDKKVVMFKPATRGAASTRSLKIISADADRLVVAKNPG